MSLTQLQSIPGEIHSILPWVPITKDSLVLLFSLLKNKKPQDVIALTPEHQGILLQFQDALDKVSLRRYSADLPVSLWLFTSAILISAVLVQKGEPIEWIHASLGGAPRVYSQTDQLADTIIRGRSQAQRHFGRVLSLSSSPSGWRMLNGFLEPMPISASPLKDSWDSLIVTMDPPMDSYSLEAPVELPLLILRLPLLILPEPILDALHMFTDGG